MDRISKVDFKGQVEKLLVWFKPKLLVDHIDMMYADLQRIPYNAIRKAVDYFIKHRKPFPSQFPTIEEFRTEAFRHLPQDRKRRPEPTPCDECGGTGIIRYGFKNLSLFGPEQSYLYDGFAYCAKCTNYIRHIGPNPNNLALKTVGRTTKAEIDAGIYRLADDDLYLRGVAQNTLKNPI